MLGSITIDPNLWPDSAVIDWWSILLRVPRLPDREQRLNEAEQIMRARLNQQGTADASVERRAQRDVVADGLAASATW